MRRTGWTRSCSRPSTNCAPRARPRTGESCGFVEGLDDRRIEGTIKYRRVSSPEQFEQALAPALAHWFNHQTRHRGQVHALLTGLAGQAPELDLLYFQRLAAKPAA